MNITSTSVTNYDYLLRNCYSYNRSARKSYARASYATNDLVLADSSALKKVSKNLKEMSYDSDNGQNIFNNVKAFVESYNNLMDSANGSSDATLTRLTKKLSSFVKNCKDDLADLGVTVSSSGKLTIDEDDLDSASATKLKKFFSSSGSFSAEVNKYASRIFRTAKSIMMSTAATKTTTTAAETDDEKTDVTEALTEAVMTSTSINYLA